MRVNRKQYFDWDEQQRERGAQLGTNRPGQSCDALNGAMTMQTSGRKGCWKYESESLEQRKNDPIFRG